MHKNDLNDALSDLFAGVIIASLMADLTKNGDPTADDFTRVNKKLENLQSKLNKKKNQLSQDSSQSEYDKIKGLTETLIQRDAEIKELKATAVSLKETLSEREADLDRQNDIIEMMDEQIKNLNDYVNHAQYDISTVEDLKKHIGTLCDEQDGLIAENNKLKTELKRLREELRVYKTRRNEARQAIDEMLKEFDNRANGQKFTCKGKKE